jgi:ketosteroid isomerase-like protein
MRIALAVMTGVLAGHQAPAPVDLRVAVDGLLAADRAFSSAAATVDVATALAAMFSAEVIVPGPTGLTRGRDAVIRALRALPENVESRAQWTPMRGGISADGQHGFTFGFMTVTPKTGAAQGLKYMAYWRREDAAWRVVGYKRARRGPGTVSEAMRSPYLPSASVPVTTDTTRLEAHRRSLADAERAFSDEAQRRGLGPAFARYGAPTAVNMGGPQSPGYVEGPEAIGAAIGAGAPGATSPVHWASETVIVASSGDLGISFGYIKAHTPPPGAPPNGQAFFTIWVRADAASPWRYIAE